MFVMILKNPKEDPLSEKFPFRRRNNRGGARNQRQDERVSGRYGVLQLKYFTRVLEKRRVLAERYREGLRDVPGISFLELAPEVDYNNAYFPIFVDTIRYGRTRDELYEYLKEYNDLVVAIFTPW